MTPGDRKYAKSHEWVKITGDTAVVGISDHAQTALGDITFVDLPAVGTQVEAGKECGAIESVKAASDIFSPVSGKVVEANAALAKSPELINKSPYEEGWLFKLKGVNAAQAGSLLDAPAYDAMAEAEGGH